jgi:hypothetical protein
MTDVNPVKKAIAGVFRSLTEQKAKRTFFFLFYFCIKEDISFYFEEIKDCFESLNVIKRIKREPNKTSLE